MITPASALAMHAKPSLSAAIELRPIVNNAVPSVVVDSTSIGHVAELNPGLDQGFVIDSFMLPPPRYLHVI